MNKAIHYADVQDPATEVQPGVLSGVPSELGTTQAAILAPACVPRHTTFGFVAGERRTWGLALPLGCVLL